VTVLQSFLEANILNDMMNFQNALVTSVLESELRRIIRGLLSDIYFAHISTLYLENYIQEQITQIAEEQLI
jgi:hypothetical protein